MTRELFKELDLTIAEIRKENQELKKQLEKLQKEYEKFQEKASDIQFELRDDRDNYYERLQDKYREQKEFIKYLENESKEIYRDGGLRQNIFSPILTKIINSFVCYNI